MECGLLNHPVQFDLENVIMRPSSYDGAIIIY